MLAGGESSKHADGVIRSCPKQRELGAAIALAGLVGEVDDGSYVAAFDSRVRRIEEARQILRLPMIAPRFPLPLVHALLNDAPPAVDRREKAVQIEIVAVLHGGAVDLGHQPACAYQYIRVHARARAHVEQFRRGASGVRTFTAADKKAEFRLHRSQPPFERTDDTGGDPGGMPIHTHDGAEGLKPKRIRETP